MQSRISAFLWDFVKKFRWEIFSFYLVTVIKDVLYIVVAGYVLEIITDKAKANDFENLVLYGILYCVILTQPCLVRIYTKSVEYKVRKKIDRYYILKMFGKILNHEISYFSNNLTGQLTAKMFNIQKKLESIFSMTIEVITDIVPFFTGMAVLYFIDPRISYFGLLWFAIYLPVVIFFFKRDFRISDKNSENIAKSVGLINDCFINIMNIKIFSSQRREFRRIKRHSLDILRGESEKIASFNIFHFVDYISFSVLIFGLLYIIFIDYMNGKATIGTIMFVFAFVSQIIYWIRWGIRCCFVIMSDAATINNSINTILVEEKIKDKKNAIALNDIDGKIVFRNVEFAYEME